MAGCLEIVVPQASEVLVVNNVVRAAGGVIVRDDPDGERRIVVVHRPRYDDWTFPKGKLLDGETHETAALREVEEETGLHCDLRQHLDAIEYRDRENRQKIVQYWIMTPRDGVFLPSAEVDDLRWLSLREAESCLTYAHDRELLRTLLRTASNAPLFLVRHAPAGSRSGWTEADELRPLSKKGRRQAERLIRQFRDVEITRIVSSPYVRCVQTVRPLAVVRGLQVDASDALTEGASTPDALALVDELAAGPAVLCTHGDVIMALVGHFAELGMGLEDEPAWQKGSTWALERLEGRFVSARYLPPPAAS
jgi:8-oxo-dGTP diphosphatase